VWRLAHHTREKTPMAAPRLSGSGGVSRQAGRQWIEPHHPPSLPMGRQDASEGPAAIVRAATASRPWNIVFVPVMIRRSDARTAPAPIIMAPNTSYHDPYKHTTVFTFSLSLSLSWKCDRRAAFVLNKFLIILYFCYGVPFSITYRLMVVKKYI